MAELTIVIPVYQVEKTLNRCIQSIVDQTYTEWKGILVDDGSPDNCPMLCDQWAKKDPRICVIHQANQGLSAARNTGISHCDTPYITFVDSDDYVAPDTYGPLMDWLRENPNCDLLEYPFCEVYPDGRKGKWFKQSKTTYHDAKTYWLDSKAYQHAYAWNKIYHRSLFNNKRFPTGRLFEDMLTMPSLITQARSITVCSTGNYFYTKNPQGITALAGNAEWQCLLEAHINAIEQLDLLSDMSPSASECYMHMFNIQLYSYAISEAGTILLPEKRIGKYLSHENMILRIKRISLNIIGLEYTCRLYKIIHRTFNRS